MAGSLMTGDFDMWDLAVANLLCFGPWIGVVLMTAVMVTWGNGRRK